MSKVYVIQGLGIGDNWDEWENTDSAYLDKKAAREALKEFQAEAEAEADDYAGMDAVEYRIQKISLKG